ncbi:MAG: enoyl-CoA hydratase/isomerase family protein [Quisquiliibacterium sp.]
MHPNLIIEQDNRLLRIQFNRAEDCGVSDSMAAALSEAVLRAHETSDAVLLSSAGADFCTGRIRDVGGPPSPEAYTRRPEYDSIFNSYKALRNCQVPVIGVIHGRAMGFGTAIAALCDISFAADTASFNIPEINHNVMPTMVMSALYDRVQRNAILWMAYSAEFISAAQAQQLGIVSNVVPQAELAAQVQRFCQTLLSRPRPAILGLKEYLHNAPRMDEQGAIDYARALHSMVNTAAQMKLKSP